MPEMLKRYRSRVHPVATTFKQVLVSSRAVTKEKASESIGILPAAVSGREYPVEEAAARCRLDLLCGLSLVAERKGVLELSVD
jgi:hypothetical protein